VLLKDEKGNFTRCQAKESNEHHFCICNGLLSSGGYNSDVEEPIYTVGATASRVDRILTVKALMAELAGA
jgi:nitronate monooxygenase